MKRVSIRKQLLTLFVPFLFSLWIASAVLSFWLVSNFSGDSFDRDLVNSADSVVGRLRVKEGRVTADLPPAAQAILKQGDSDKFYYRVVDADGHLISGDANMPAPSADLQVDLPKVATANIGDKSVRLAEIKTVIDDSKGQTVTVQVAETTNVRRSFQEKMLLSIALPQLFIIVVGFLAIWYGIRKILTPLRLLQQQVLHRSQSDLSPFSDVDTPEEVYPLVRAFNLFLNRLRCEIQAHERFIANAAHQLRTPLAGLKTYSSIGSEMSDSAELRHVVSELDHGIDRASRIVCQLLALARADAGDAQATPAKSSIDLNFLVSDVVAEMTDEATRKNVDLTYEWSSQSATIYGELTSLKHLLTNLIENAILYSGGGSKVLVSVSKDSGVNLSVADNGPGIPIEERDKIFERFYRITGTGGNGSGLGLAIVKEVAGAHQATVEVHSGHGGAGTTVLVKFRE
jgi:two-component system, OmpR family, sensor histidine kinase TctE